MTSPRKVVIEAVNVGKKFRIRSGGTHTLKASALDWMRGRRRQDFWALKNVGFSVEQGETVGIIGTNGAGKSTLLGLLTGTMEATEGTIQTRGNVSSLLELGAGFHPDLTGRENIFLYGAIMGLPRSRMRERFEDIVEFAGLRDFIDQPVKHYSSGMHVRLGFAVAVEVDPDILLIDEVLAVGDFSFQRKCIDKMNDFRNRGKTMLIVSHDLPTIQKMSDRILLLEDGKVKAIGDPESIVGSYRASSAKKETSGLAREWGSGEIKLTGVSFHDSAGNECEFFDSGSTLTIVLSYAAEHHISEPVFGFALSDERGNVLYGNNTQMSGIDIPSIEGTGSVEISLDKLYLSAGSYMFSFSVHSADHSTNYHRLDNAFAVACRSDRTVAGPCAFPCNWEIRT